MLIARHPEKPIDVPQFQTLCGQAEWMRNRSAAELLAMLEGTWLALGAWDGEKLVGFARAISDGVFRAFIEDVIVDTKYRRVGIGSSLVERLVDALSNIEEISLTCREDLVPWYGQQGFQRATQPALYILRSRER